MKKKSEVIKDKSQTSRFLERRRMDRQEDEALRSSFQQTDPDFILSSAIVSSSREGVAQSADVIRRRHEVCPGAGQGAFIDQACHDQATQRDGVDDVSCP